MRNLQTASLPSLSLGIQPVHILNGIYEKDRILADSYFRILQIVSVLYSCDFNTADLRNAENAPDNV